MNNKGISFQEWRSKDKGENKTTFVRYLKYLKKNNYDYNTLNSDKKKQESKKKEG